MRVRQSAPAKLDYYARILINSRLPCTIVEG